MKFLLLLITCIIFFSTLLSGQVSASLFQDETGPNPNFHIYLCFGQSNMEGNATIADDDKIGVDERFQVMTVAPEDFTHLNRQVGNWYTAIPPLCRWNTGLTPADYFGRTLVVNLKNDVKVGVIVVAMGGSGIDAFDKDNYTQYYQNADAWQKSLMDIYGGNPYSKIIELAKQAQKQGVIKGILLHQGESNNGQTDWPQKVKKIYYDMLEDLQIEANTIPLLAGEMLHQDQGGICWGMNNILATLPNYIPNSHIISSDGCPGTDDFHFATEGARELGNRYGLQMLSLLKSYDTQEGQTIDHLAMESHTITMVTGDTKRVPLTAVFVDEHIEDICYKATYGISNPEVIHINNGIIETLQDGSATITASYQGSLGVQKTIEFEVIATTFPLTNELFNADIWENGTFDEATHLLQTGQWGFGGWQYEGVNLSDYKYIIAKLGSDNKADVDFRLFDENSYWSSPASYQFGNSRDLVIDISNATKSDGAMLNPNHIYIAGFWSTGSNPFVIDTVFLSNSGELNQTSINDLFMDNSEPGVVDVYTIYGVKIRSDVERDTAIDSLPKGIYIIGKNNSFVKIIK